METNDQIDFEVFSSIVKNYIKEIASCVSVSDFQTVAKHSFKNKSRATIVHDIFQLKVGKSLTEEWEGLCQRENLESRYNMLTGAVEKYRNTDKSAWRPTTGDVNDQLKVSRMQILQSKKEALESVVSKLEAENELLQTQVIEKRTSTKLLMDEVNVAQQFIPQVIDNYKIKLAAQITNTNKLLED